MKTIQFYTLVNTQDLPPPLTPPPTLHLVMGSTLQSRACFRTKELCSHN